MIIFDSYRVNAGFNEGPLSAKSGNETAGMLAVLFNLAPTLFKQLGLLSVLCFSLSRLALAIATVGKKGSTENQGT
ncbi:hypothetical protein PseuLF5_06235 [Pseudomonas sp. LF-5]|uniref:hypothetical protein n=1 Tax=Pseudomonas sp. LF-5 TaxID=3031121 RepID=UPI00309A7AD4